MPRKTKLQYYETRFKRNFIVQTDYDKANLRREVNAEDVFDALYKDGIRADVTVVRNVIILDGKAYGYGILRKIQP